MRFTTLQWNIGGGKIREKDATAEGPYTHDGLRHIEDVISYYKADIVTLQETHVDENRNQGEEIGASVGLPHGIHDDYDDSHIEHGQRLGQSILSRFPIHGHSFELFSNPRLDTIGPDGARWLSHDKGVTKCTTTINGTPLQVATLHLIPFRKFGVDPLAANLESLRANIENLVMPTSEHFLLQGDFNFDDKHITSFLPTLFKKGIAEIVQEQPTTPKNQRLDHVLFRGLSYHDSEVNTEVLTDHYPIISTFEL